ncbi:MULTISPECIES: extracellular solute-binding protein [unclassified Sagittula]|jgi:microcin C transport system substrate-binding protein|uniref:extracellular solute-binding protein n=1 Tax=unclassified Sagittula TaxID=2624628 RepID=UPI0024C2BE71|nr:extracellular solute-binding protein [Sagittula sp. MA-2]WHZ36351.1 extracellular solute-binding protein [Sagittula sp. MA-2]
MTRRPPFHVDRRSALGLIGATAATPLLPRTGWAESHEMADTIRAHGYSFYGDLKYPADYPHFAYVNPDAPKGGEIVIGARGTFDGFNRWAWRGNPETNSGVVAESMFGEMPWGGGLPADTITDSYCLVAREVEYPEDQTWVIFHMRDDVTFRNGAPVRAQDAAFTHNLFIEQGIRSYARSVSERISGVEVIDDLTLKYTFVDGISRRSLISQVGGTPIFSEEWYKETGEKLDEPSVLSPMASGPYQVADYEFNRYVVYERNPNYWGWDHPANIGRHNFDRVRFEYFADDTAEFEAFKAGITNFRTEGSTKLWATGYEFPAIQRGDVVKKEIPDQSAPNNSGIIFNTTREPLDNRNIRHALSLAYNFEWERESLQYSLTTQRKSFVEGQEWEAKGLPEGKEKALLESLGELVPPDMMTEEAVMPHSSDARDPIDRRNKRTGLRLLEQEGWTVNADGKMVNEAGQQMTLNFLVLSSWDDTRKSGIETYVRTLNDWGIAATADTVDSAQGQQRFLDKDYDMIHTRILTFAAAGTGLNQLFGSETAVVSSYNPAALRSPLVDAIIEAALDTKTREDEIAALMALDRALRYERIQVAAGFVPEYWVAYYDMFEHPDELPPYALGVLDFWWMNEEKHQALQSSGVLK